MKKGLIVAGVFCFAIAGGISLSGATKPGDVAKGKEAFEASCSICHNADSTEKKMGPGLKGLYKKAAMNNKKKPSDATVLELINKGNPGGMPPFEDQLSDQEKADVLAYLKSL